MSRRSKIIAAVATLVVVAGTAAGIALGAGGSAPEVDVAVVQEEDLSVTVSASGKVEAGAKADVLPPTAGLLASVDVKDGQSVKSGQVLAVMDTAPLELQVAQAEAGAAAARSQLAQVDAQRPSSAERKAASAGVQAAQAAYDAASDAYEALKEAYDEAPAFAKASMEPTLTQAEIAKKQAYAAYLQAKAEQARLQQSLTAQRRAAQISLDQANDALALARETLKKATLRAPIDGVVLFNPMGTPGSDGQLPKPQAGSAVAPQAAPFSVVQMDALRFAADVDEVDVDDVDPGMKGTVTLDAFPGDVLEASVIEVRMAAQQTPTGGTVFPVYLDLSGVAQKLLIGMKGDVDIKVRGVTGAVTIPIEALFDEDDVKFVYVVENDTLKRRDVVTGVVTDTSAQVLEGLAPGETVALSGAEELKDGMAVRPKE